MRTRNFLPVRKNLYVSIAKISANNSPLCEAYWDSLGFNRLALKAIGLSTPFGSGIGQCRFHHENSRCRL